MMMSTSARPASLTLFLCGDVMTGRGIDQILARPSCPELRESFIHDARDYVALAEERNGRIRRAVDPLYVWGAAAEQMARADARLVNLETSITAADAFWPDKGIHYRMHPENAACLRSARVDACALANNHVLDFGREGLAETLEVLKAAGIRACGAGRTAEEARAPARVPVGGAAALLVFAMGAESSGIPPEWAAGADRPGVELLPDLSEATAERVAERIRAQRRPGELAVASIHWGGNWGYAVPGEQSSFAHRLIDGGVDLVHGHSSHHPRAIEVYRGRLVLYGCGDFIDDYEGIGGYEEFRPELRPMYFATLALPSGALQELRIVPLWAERLTLREARPEEVRWLGSTLSKVSHCFGTRVEASAGSRELRAAW